MDKKKQVIVIHGGDFFDSREEFVSSLKEAKIEKKDLLSDQTRRWKDNLQNDLGSEYEVLLPQMPLKYHARYDEWKLWFEKLIPFLEDGIVLVGHSLGGIFLARYLSENDFPKGARAVFFVAAPYFGAATGHEGENSGFVITKSLRRLEEQARGLVFYYSDDDAIVSPSHARKYEIELSKAKFHIFKDKGHFFAQEHFPELVSAIKSLS